VSTSRVPDQRVVLIRAGLPDGGVSVGSGTLLDGRQVLTAAHVVFADDGDPLPTVRVGLPESPELAAARVVWPERYLASTGREDVDAALLQVDADQADALPRVGPVRWGWLTGRSPVEVAAVGFPRVLRDPDGTRDTDHLTGRVSPGSRRVAGRYDITVTSAVPQLPTSPRAPSPWSGMSGAGLFAAGRLIGVVIIDEPGYPANRLSALPVSRLAADPTFTPHAGDRRMAVESVELAELLVPPGQPVLARRRRGGTVSPATLLRADAEAVPFSGREQLLEDLIGWCTDPRLEIGVWLLIGPGGQGKTRLARHLARRLLSEVAGDGAAGLLAADPPDTAHDLSPLVDSRLPLLVVVDYAETRTEQLRRLLPLLWDATDGPPVRLLLLARSAGDWWAQLQRDLDDELGPSLRLQALSAPTERASTFAAAVGALSARLPEVDATVDWASLAATVTAPRDLADDHYGNPLTLQLAALIGLLQVGPHPTIPDNSDAESRVPEAVLLQHEQRYWTDSSRSRRLSVHPDTLRDAVTVAGLCGARSPGEAMSLLEQLPGLRGQTVDALRHVDSWLTGLYPADPGRRWGSLQPDRLAEHLAVSVLTDDPDLLPGLLTAATAGQTVQALSVVTRALTNPSVLPDRRTLLLGELTALLAARLDQLAPVALQVATQTAAPGPLLAAVEAAATSADLDSLARLTNTLPASSFALAPLAAALNRRLVEELRARAVTDPANFLPDLAAALNNQSNRLADLGRREDALTASEEAVGHYRTLAAARPDAFLPDLAAALNNQSNRLANLGRREDALTAIAEAVQIRRALAAARPDAFRPDLAMSLNNQSSALADLGRREDALTASAEAVGHYRTLAAARPDAFRPDLAAALNNQSNRLANLGRREDALTAIEEAVQIRRALAAARPDAFRPDLAMSLNNQSNRLANLGRREDALIASAEAVGHYRALAAARPVAFLPDLAMSLNNQSNRLADRGRRQDALTAVTEAVQIRRVLADKHPVFLETLARSLTSQGIRLTELGDFDAALAADREAVSLYTELIALDPVHYRDSLEQAVDNLVIDLRDLGRTEQEVADELDRLSLPGR